MSKRQTHDPPCGVTYHQGASSLAWARSLTVHAAECSDWVARTLVALIFSVCVAVGAAAITGNHSSDFTAAYAPSDAGGLVGHSTAPVDESMVTVILSMEPLTVPPATEPPSIHEPYSGQRKKVATRFFSRAYRA